MKTPIHLLVLCINDYYANFAYMPLEIITHFMMHVHLLNPLRSGGHLVVASKGVKCASSEIKNQLLLLKPWDILPVWPMLVVHAISHINLHLNS